MRVLRRPDATVGDLWGHLDDLEFSHEKAVKSHICKFGITEVAAAALISVGVGEATAAIAAPILLGAATGAIGSAITGGNPLTGALVGGIGGGFGELGGFVGDALDIGNTAGGALAGAAGGALGAGITGGDPLMGAGMGALSGGISGYASSQGGATGADGVSSPTANGENVGQGPTQAAANATSGAAGAVDPNSLAALSSASAPSAGGSPLTPSASPLSTGSTGANSSFLNPDSVSSNNFGLTYDGSNPVGSTATGAPTTTAPSSPGFLDRASNYLFGSGSSSNATPSMTAQQALQAQQSTGQAQTFTQNGQMGIVSANGSVTMIPGNATSSKSSGGALGGIFGGSGSGGVLGSLTSNPLQTALLGTQLYSMSQSPSLPTLQQQQASAQGPTFTANLPHYNVSQTRNPIADYYTYGYSPQPTQISTTLTPTNGAGTGNAPLTLAAGGIARPRLPGAPHIGLPRHNTGAGLATLGAMSHMRRAGALSAAPVAPAFAHGGEVFDRDGQVQHGTGASGQKDNVPAMLSEDEYVIPADVVSHLGDGSSNAGGGVLNKLVANVRKAKAVKGMPPPAKAPEHYMRGAR